MRKLRPTRWSFTCPSHCRVEAGLEFRLTGSPSWCAPPGCTGGKASIQADSLWEEQHKGREAAGTFGRNLSLECHPRASMGPLSRGFLMKETKSYSPPHTHSFSFIYLVRVHKSFNTHQPCAVCHVHTSQNSIYVLERTPPRA